MIEGDHPVTATGVADLIGRLGTDARELARAEVALVKARGLDVVDRYKAAAIFFSVAGVIALAALIAMFVGLIETLAPITGPGFATLIVVGAALMLAGILGFVGKSRLTVGKVTS